MASKNVSTLHSFWSYFLVHEVRFNFLDTINRMIPTNDGIVNAKHHLLLSSSFAVLPCWNPFVIQT